MISKKAHVLGAVVLGLIVSLAAIGAVYEQFSPGGALSGTWNSQNVNVAAGSPFIIGTLPAGNGGTGSAFAQFAGPATTVKTLTLPNANATLLSDANAVTVAQGGTGAGTLTGILQGNGTSAITGLATVPFASGGTGLASAADDTTLISTGSAWQAKAIPNCGSATQALAYATSTNTFSCQTVTGSATTPAGADTQVQFNNAGAFGADADYTWNSTTNVLSLGSTATAASIVSPNNGAGNGPNLSITAGNAGGALATGGAVLITGGNAGSTGTSGGVTLQAGTPTDGAGGTLRLIGANGVGTNRAGSFVSLEPGVPTGSGALGSIQVVNSTQTGAQTATFIATNKPGSGTTSPSLWLRIVSSGTTYYIPMWQ